MKQLLLLTAISLIFATEVSAGSSCKTCPTAPAQNSTQPQADVKDANKDADTDVVKEPLASNASSNTSDTSESSELPASESSQSETPAQLLA